jgi:hypothetical protein
VLTLSTHWFGSSCDAAVRVEFSFEYVEEVDVTMMVNHLVIVKCYFGSNWDLDQHEEVD